jgi:6,7-dimethyl-8-ribityllumazine synthase
MTPTQSLPNKPGLAAQLGSYEGADASAIQGVGWYPASLDARALRFGIAVSRFNHALCVKLLDGAVHELESLGAPRSAIDVAWVPGAFELPLAARGLATSGRYRAILALGIVIRGGTPHFEYVCNGVTSGLVEVMRDTGIPVAFGVLTTDDVEQAVERCGGSHGNKGAEAARAAVEMAQLANAIARGPTRPEPK